MESPDNLPASSASKPASRPGRSKPAIDWIVAKSMSLAGHSHAQIAKALNVPRGTISSRAKRESWSKARNPLIEPAAQLAVAHANDIVSEFVQLAAESIKKQGRAIRAADPSDIREMDQLSRAISNHVNAGMKLFRLDAQATGPEMETLRMIRPARVIDVQSSTAPAPSQVIEFNPDGTPK